MTMARFAPGEEARPGWPMFIVFIREVNGIRPDTFTAPQNFADQPRKGYDTEWYGEAAVIHGPGDEGVRVIAYNDEVRAAFREAAQNLGIHLADQDE
jgi:predicted transcriptional regulator